MLKTKTIVPGNANKQTACELTQGEDMAATWLQQQATDMRYYYGMMCYALADTTRDVSFTCKLTCSLRCLLVQISPYIDCLHPCVISFAPLDND